MNNEEQLEEFKRSITLRRATAHDMPEVAVVFRESRRDAFPFLPQLYTRHGFRVLKETDGAQNEEKEPDALLEWS